MCEKIFSRIILNVGGTLFETIKDTLNKMPKSFFSTLLETEEAEIDSNGKPVYFIDRNPKYFPFIPVYLRDSDACILPDIVRELYFLCHRY